MLNTCELVNCTTASKEQGTLKQRLPSPTVEWIAFLFTCTRLLSVRVRIDRDTS